MNRKKAALILKALCFLALEINVIVYFCFAGKGHIIDFKAEAIISLLLIVADGLHCVYMAIEREDFVVFPTFAGSLIISLCIVSDAFNSLSALAGTVILGCTAVLYIALTVVYTKWLGD